MSTSSDPRLGAIRLAWWRERLEDMDERKAPPAEPRLISVASELLPHGITARELAALEDGWLPLLEPFPWGESQADALKLRGRVLFGIGARLLGGESSEAQSPGELWALHDGAVHCSDAESRAYLDAEALRVVLPRKVSRTVRPLTVLAALTLPNILDPASGVARGMAALNHRITGRFDHRR